MITSGFFLVAVLTIAPSLLHEQVVAPSGFIEGNADPGAQIVITGADDGSVIGVMAACDGTYKTNALKPGHYSIVEGGPHHAVRKLSVEAGTVAHVDLGAASPTSTRECNERAQKH
jgi:hypothetical protein